MKPRIGYCKCCGVRQFDPATPPSDWLGKRATVLLADGSQMAVTLCAACADAPSLTTIWANTLAGWLGENANQYAAKQLRTNFILYLLYTAAWVDIAKEGIA